MAGAAFNTAEYLQKLKAAGVPEKQAQAMAEGMRAQVEGLHRLIQDRDFERRNDQASKGEIQDLRIKIKVMENRLLKWQLGVCLALAFILVKIFGWLPF